MDDGTARTIARSLGGAPGFLVGAVVSQLVLGLLVGLPMLFATILAPRLSVDSAIAAGVAGLMGSMLAVWVGSAFGRRKELNWRFAVGAGLVPAYMALTAVRGLFTAADSFGIAMVGGFAVGGLALCAGFWIGRKRMVVAH